MRCRNFVHTAVKGHRNRSTGHERVGGRSVGRAAIKSSLRFSVTSFPSKSSANTISLGLPGNYYSPLANTYTRVWSVESQEGLSETTTKKYTHICILFFSLISLLDFQLFFNFAYPISSIAGLGIIMR